MRENKDIRRDIRWYERDDDDTFFGQSSVASFNDCTGLIPTPPLSQDEEEAYIEIYDIPRPRREGHKR